MLLECLEIFKEHLEKYSDKLILDNYTPADGTYILVEPSGAVRSIVDIRMDKKTREIPRDSVYFKDICFYDYYSQLISMNKPQDPGKVIHSNNYLSFWIKKDSLANGKLTAKGIETYYEILRHPEEKYVKPKAKEIYRSAKEEIGDVDEKLLEDCRKWIEDHIFSLSELSDDIDLSKKEYLKIFFLMDRELYLKEAKRYFLPNIYNSNDYNVKVDGTIYGLPDNNLGMNAKKPYLSVKTRKTAGSYLVNSDEAMVQKKFFDYLMGFAAKGQNNIYVDFDEKKFVPCKNGEFPLGSLSGFFLRLQKGKEVEIHSQDVIPYFSNQLEEKFEYQNILQHESLYHPEHQYSYIKYDKRSELETLVDEIFFSKLLKNNYFTPAEDVSIYDGKLKRILLTNRERIFNWLHKGAESNISGMLKKDFVELIKEGIENDYRDRAARQLNLRWSLLQYLEKEGKDMAGVICACKEKLRVKINSSVTVDIENDEEYYFAVGQLTAYLLSLNKSSKKNQSLIKPFINAKTNITLKKKLVQLHSKYGYAIDENSRRAKNLIAMVMAYDTEEKVDQVMVMAGYTCNKLIYEKGDN